jgi:hypothetical protein
MIYSGQPGDLKKVLHELQSKSQEHKDSINAIEKSLAEMRATLKQNYAMEKSGARDPQGGNRRSTNQEEKRALKASKTCLKCKSTGHLQEDCWKPQCESCGSYHSFANPPGEGCEKPKPQRTSFAPRNQRSQDTRNQQNSPRLLRSLDFKTSLEENFDMIGLKGLHPSKERSWGSRTDSFTDLDESDASDGEEKDAETRFRVKMMQECFPGFGKEYIKEWLSRHNGDCELTGDHLARLSDGTIPPGKSPEPLSPSNNSQAAGEEEGDEEVNMSILHECFPDFNKAYIKGYVDRYNGDWAKVTSHLSKVTEPEYLPEPNHLGKPPSKAEQNRREFRALHEDFPDFEQWYLKEWRAHYNGYCHLERAPLPKLLSKMQDPEGNTPGGAANPVSPLRPPCARSLRRLEACHSKEPQGPDNH